MTRTRAPRRSTSPYGLGSATTGAPHHHTNIGQHHNSRSTNAKRGHFRPSRWGHCKPSRRGLMGQADQWRERPPFEALAACRPALVGHGELEAQVRVPTQAPFEIHAHLLAFNGRVLNRPSDGYERPLADSFQLTYIGVYTPKPRLPVFSPNGDGYADTQALYTKLVRRSNVDISLYRPNGSLQWHLTGERDPGILKKRIGSRTLPEGLWRWIATAVDAKGRSSRMERRFRLNRTLGYVTLSKSLMRVRRHAGGRLRVGFQLAHAADVKVTISRRSGQLVRTLAAISDLGAGGYAVIWNGRNASGRVVRSGRFVATVQAKNVLGRVTQAKGFAVRRVR